MKFRKTLKVLAASALLFGTVGLATACGDNNGGTTVTYKPAEVEQFVKGNGTTATAAN